MIDTQEFKKLDHFFLQRRKILKNDRLDSKKQHHSSLIQFKFIQIDNLNFDIQDN